MAITPPAGRNIVSVSWGDHLMFGEDDGRLATPAALGRRLIRWQTDLNAGTLHWRVQRTRLDTRFFAARGRSHPVERTRTSGWDDVAVVPRLAHEAGVRAYLYVAIFDDGWPLPPKRVRVMSYHNRMHGQHVSWQSAFSRAHPSFAVIDRHRRRRQWGVLCLAYPEVRSHLRSRCLDLIAPTDFDGLFVCLRSQSRPADSGDQYGFNEPVRQDFLRHYGQDIWKDDFDRIAWRRLLGSYLTIFLLELRAELRGAGKRLAVGAARGDVLGPPLGNGELQWRRWVSEGVVDELVINQNSSQCPSMWHQLWPMHRGTGYVQNYLDGTGLPSLAEHLKTVYPPVFTGQTARLYVARQWDARSRDEEAALLDQPVVAGLVFSSFRFDNPAAVARDDWRA